MVPDNKSLGNSLGAGVFYGIGVNVLTRILERYFTFDIALAFAALILMLIGYPLFVKGTANIWMKDKRIWTFPSYLAVVLGVATVIFLAGRLFFLGDA